MKIILETLCGCTREMEIHDRPPEIRVPISRPEMPDERIFQTFRPTLHGQRVFQFYGATEEGVIVYREKWSSI